MRNYLRGYLPGRRRKRIGLVTKLVVIASTLGAIALGR